MFFKLNGVHALKRTYSPSGNHTSKAKKTFEDQKEITVCFLQNGCSAKKLERFKENVYFRVIIQKQFSETFTGNAQTFLRRSNLAKHLQKHIMRDLELLSELKNNNFRFDRAA